MKLVLELKGEEHSAQKVVNKKLNFQVVNFIFGEFLATTNYFNTQRFLLMSNLVLAGHSAPMVRCTPQTPPTSLKLAGQVRANDEQMKASRQAKSIRNFMSKHAAEKARNLNSCDT